SPGRDQLSGAGIPDVAAARRALVSPSPSTTAPTTRPPTTTRPQPTTTRSSTPAPAPSVSIAVGASAVGQPGCSSAACAKVSVALANFAAGSHRVSCNSDVDGEFYVYATSATSSAVCYFGYAG